jgi:Uma2 family endonuclease
MASITKHKLITVDEYDRMIEQCIIDENEQVELWEGAVVPKMPKSPRHRVATRMTAISLEKIIPGGWYVTKEDAIVIWPRSKPEPDVAVIRSEFEFDTSRDPTATDCCLVIEVADSSLEDDRGKQLNGHARAGIPVYWIVNLRENQVEVYTAPDMARGQYGKRTVYEPGSAAGSSSSLIPLIIEGQEVARIPLAEILPGT